jgi:murein DD-endopeptidase MepM/ murein hydrolase activator NlpD
MLLGMPVALDYVVRPGDTLSEIAQRHDTSVERLVARNELHRSGDQVVAGQTLHIPAAHGRPASSGSAGHGGPISPDARKIVRYTVRPGDTPSGLAVRFRAWTDEVIERNGAVLHVGEQVEIPVVLAAVARDRRAASAPAGGSQGGRAAAPRSDTGPSRATVRRVIAATARRHGVDPDLALAVSWQEAGWQMHHVSSADAIGAMQVVPATGEWMSGLVGRDLDLHDLQDNATAGVVLLKVLQQQARTRIAVAGYYQGLAGVRKHGMYDDTKRYVANVMALQGRFERGEYPG